MNKFFEKNETLCLIILIAGYVILNSYLMKNFGYTSCISFIANTLYSCILLSLIFIDKKQKYYGLVKVNNLKQFLYFIPLVLIVLSQFLGGISINKSASEILFHILTMINVGFLEEIIFRGILFRSIEKDDKKLAIIISSLTFGIGHIVNILNGAELIPTLIQIAYATAIGFMFVTIFIKSKSLIPCIITHMAINSLSVFTGNMSELLSYLIPVLFIVISISYTMYLNKIINE